MKLPGNDVLFIRKGLAVPDHEAMTALEASNVLAASNLPSVMRDTTGHFYVARPILDYYWVANKLRDHDTSSFDGINAMMRHALDLQGTRLPLDHYWIHFMLFDSAANETLKNDAPSVGLAASFELCVTKAEGFQGFVSRQEIRRLYRAICKYTEKAPMMSMCVTHPELVKFSRRYLSYERGRDFEKQFRGNTTRSMKLK